MPDSCVTSVSGWAGEADASDVGAGALEGLGGCFLLSHPAYIIAVMATSVVRIAPLIILAHLFELQMSATLAPRVYLMVIGLFHAKLSRSLSTSSRVVAVAGCFESLAKPFHCCGVGRMCPQIDIRLVESSDDLSVGVSQ